MMCVHTTTCSPQELNIGVCHESSKEELVMIAQQRGCFSHFVEVDFSFANLWGKGKVKHFFGDKFCQRQIQE